MPGYEPIVHAIVGTMADQIGHRDGPIFEALPFASIGAAYIAVIGILASLFRREKDGGGHYIETSLYDGALMYMMSWGTTDSKTPQPRKIGDRRSVIRTLRCADEKYINVHTGAVGAFNRLINLLGLSDKIATSSSGLDMTAFASEEELRVLETEVPKIFSGQPSSFWLDELLKADVCVMPALKPGEVFDEPQTVFNGMVVEVTDPVLGRVQQIGPAVRLSGTAQANRPVNRPWERMQRGAWQTCGRCRL